MGGADASGNVGFVFSCVRECTGATRHLWRSEDSFLKSFLPICLVGMTSFLFLPHPGKLGWQPLADSPASSAA